MKIRAIDGKLEGKVRIWGVAALLGSFSLMSGAALAQELDVDGSVIALIGGAQGGFLVNQYPTLSPTTLARQASVQLTTPSFANPGVYADITAQASVSAVAGFGSLQYASATGAQGYGAYAAGASGGYSARASDVVTFHGSGPITVTLHEVTTGLLYTSDPANSAVSLSFNINLSPFLFTDNSRILNLSAQYSGTSIIDNGQQASITVANGESFSISGAGSQNNSMQLLNGQNPFAPIWTYASTEGTTDYWLELSSGATLTSDSGWTYTAPVPEPGSATAVAAGLLLLSAPVWRRLGAIRRV